MMMNRLQPNAGQHDGAPRWLPALRTIAWAVAAVLAMQPATRGSFRLANDRAASRALGAECLPRSRAFKTGLEWEAVWEHPGSPLTPPDSAPVTVRLTALCTMVGVLGEPLSTPNIQGHTAADGSRVAIDLTSSDHSARVEVAGIGRLGGLSATVGVFAAILGLWLIGRRNRACSATSGVGGPAAANDSQQAQLTRLAQELENARRQLQDGLVERERFLSNVSHELKTPIAVLMIEAQTIDRKNCSDAMRRFVETVEGEMTRLGRLVESLLLLTRVQSGRSPGTLKCYGLNDMVVDSIESCTALASQFQVALRPTLLAQDATVDSGVVGDPDLLRTLVENLLRHSIRFSPAGSTIDVVARVDGETAAVTVADHGPGIPPDRLKTIFDRFASTQEPQEHGRGHGLGLAVAKGIAELHGGTIQAFNREEGGCEFVVRLRLAPSAAA